MAFPLNDKNSLDLEYTQHLEPLPCFLRWDQRTYQQFWSRTRNIVYLQSYLRMKHCVIQMENKDELRCVRAIVVAKTKRDDNPQSMVSRLRTHKPHLAHELLKCVVSLVFVVSRRSRSSRLSSRNTSSTWLQGTFERLNLFRFRSREALVLLS